jgi:hypothetical protein
VILRPLAALGATAAVLTSAGCSGAPEAEAQQPSQSPSPSAAGAQALPPAAQLAARAALAQDQYYSASYRFTPGGGGSAGTARVERTRGGFRLDLVLPGDDTHVERTTVVVRTPAGTVHCRLTAAGRGCLPAGTKPPAGLDPRLHLAFTDWLAKLADPSAAISVTVVPAPAGGSGTCFSVEGTAASLDPPVDPGIYCFDNVGRITSLRLAAGQLSSVQMSAAPSRVALPAPVGGAVPPDAAPSPTPSVSPSTGPTRPVPEGNVSTTPRHSPQRR